MERHFGRKDQLVPFLRYAVANRGIEDVLDQGDDLIGLACSWQGPTDPTLRNQPVFETFYRFYMTLNTHLTPGVQVVVDLAYVPAKDGVQVTSCV